MAPMTSESANIQPRRQAFVATCSPDELLGQVIQTLCPLYNIDAPHLLALRRVLSSAIVAPRTPPTLKRTRPDKRIGEISSIDEKPRRSSYGPNGPPLSAYQSFYFHHKDADFEKLLPAVDRSLYEWNDKPASPSEVDSEQISASQEGLHSEDSTAATPASNSGVLKIEIAAISPSPAECTKEAPHKPNQLTQGPGLTVNSESDSSDGQLLSSDIIPEMAPKEVSTSSRQSQDISVLDNTIISPRSMPSKAICERENTTLSPTLLPVANDTVELPGAQGMDSVPPTPYTALPFYLSQFSDTQDSVNSYQQGEVFSPLDGFEHYTPPTQETQDAILTQIEDSNLYPCSSLRKYDTVASDQSPRVPPQVSSSGLPPVPMPSQGKRSRGQAEATDETRLLKRSKSNETA